MKQELRGMTKECSRLIWILACSGTESKGMIFLKIPL